MDKMRCLKGAMFLIIAFFCAPLAQASNMSLTAEISNLTINLINVNTGQIINPNAVATQVQVYGVAYYPQEETGMPESTGTGSASISYTGGYFNAINGSANYNLPSNKGGISINLNVNGPNPDTGVGEAWASIQPYSEATHQVYNIKTNIHVIDYARYALQISGNYAYNAQINQAGGNLFSYFYWNIAGEMRASFPIVPLNTSIPLFNGRKTIGLYNTSGTPIAPIEENYDSGMITGIFNYTTTPGLLIGGDYYCDFLIGDGIRGQTTPFPLWSPPGAVPIPPTVLLLGSGLLGLAGWRRFRKS